jgi:two-component system NtrC family sensor kinase
VHPDDRATVRTTLTRKFILATMAVVCVVLLGSAIVELRRERLLFEEDMAHDATTMVGALADAFAERWRSGGRLAARELLRRAEASTGAIRIGWRPLEDVDIDRRARGAGGASLEAPLSAVSWRQLQDGEGYLVTAVRLDSPDGRHGAILVAESLADEQEYIRGSLRNHLVTLLALLVLGGAGTWFVGQHFVGRPVELLVHKARRAGSGDLGGPVVVSQRDELGELASEMNQMCDRLAESGERVRAESEARLEALEQLRHAERLGTVGRLASGVAHELGTPLNVVLARAGLIRAGAGGDEIDQHALAIERQVQRMSQIIRGLLDFSRTSAARKARVSPERLAGATAAMLRPMAHKAGVSISVELTGGAPPPPAVADEGQLQQVLTNLVVNAIQASPPGGQVRIAIGSAAAGAIPLGPGGERVDGTALLITVSDDGPGMNDSVLRKVFDPFFTTKPVGEGTGLGLAVSQGIVREHGGFIDVESTEGHGSRFTVVLPTTV